VAKRLLGHARREGRLRKPGTAVIGTVALALALALYADGVGSQPGTPTRAPAASTKRKEGREMKIRLNVGDRRIAATLLDSVAARDFAKLLSLMLTMNDLFGREKYGHLPRKISKEGHRTRTYEVGQIAYWPPGPDVAVFYRHSGESIPAPGIIVLGTIDSGVEALAFGGSGKVTFELAE
jgi:hypothetical protein